MRLAVPAIGLLSVLVSTAKAADGNPRARERGALMLARVWADPKDLDFIKATFWGSMRRRMDVVRCDETTEDESLLRALFAKININRESDSPARVELLKKLTQSDCKAPEGKEPWVASLVAYVDSRSNRRQIALLLRNLNDREGGPLFTRCAEPQHAQLEWGELVEKCVRLSFQEDVPHLSVESATIHAQTWRRIELEAQFPGLEQAATSEALGPVQWSLYECWDEQQCNDFRYEIEKYPECGADPRAAKNASCVNLDPKGPVHLVRDSLNGSVHWLSDPPGLKMDLAGDYVLVASIPSAAHPGAQRLIVEPPPNVLRLFAGPAYRPVDLFTFLSYHRVILSGRFAHFGVGLEWGLRFGLGVVPQPHFGARGVAGPSAVLAVFPSNALGIEASVTPLGFLYEESGALLDAGTMGRLSIVWHLETGRPRAGLSIQLGAVAMQKTARFETVEVYGPLAGFALDL